MIQTARMPRRMGRSWPVQKYAVPGFSRRCFCPTHYIFDGTTGEMLDTDDDNIPNEAEATPREPDTSDNYIVSKTIYDSSISSVGQVVQTVDNAGTITQTEYDLLGRQIRTIQNYANGTVEETDLDRDVTVEYEYDAFGRMVTLIAYNAKGNDNQPTTNVVLQKTAYLYGSHIDASWQTAVVYPDSTDVLSQDSTTKVWTITTDNGDHTSTDYDRLGRTVGTTDQRGVVHAYTFDTAGRLSDDAVTSLGTSGIVNNSIQRINTIYDDLGRVATITSYWGATPINQIAYEYDGWGNVRREYQAHDDVVNTNSTLYTEYTYVDGDPTGTGAAKFVRLDTVTYPNGREIHYDYGTTGAIDDIMSRISAIEDDVATATVASYKYLGTGSIVEESYAQIAVKLSYLDSSNNITGLDRFGRIVDQIWTDYANDEVLDHYHYTYDRAGNRTSKENELHSDFDETYTYDDLYRLATTTRADNFDQSWTLDGLGNWSEFDDDGTSETRTVNEANEIETISGTSIDPTYDKAGNMISGPDPDDSAVRLHYVYDAWNRLVEVHADSTVTPGTPGLLIARYEYDPQNRRILKGVDNNSDGTLDTFTHFFQNLNNQVLETREGAAISGEGPTAESLTPTHQNIWSPRYIDSLILRDTYDSEGDVILPERIFYLSDANYNVTGLVKYDSGQSEWQVVERYLYTPYGDVTILDADFTTDADQLSDHNNVTLYTGRELDLESGLMYYRARYYDVSLGRFISRDPIGYKGSKWNLYEYVKNQPTNATDPDGLKITKYKCEFKYNDNGWTRTFSNYLFTTCGSLDEAMREGYGSDFTVTGEQMNMTPDETAVADMCAGTACEDAIAKIMSVVANTSYSGNDLEDYPGPCFEFLRNCQKEIGDKPLPGGCTIEYLVVTPYKARLEKCLLYGQPVKPVYSSLLGLVMRAYAQHGVGRVCVPQADGTKKCMYFDVGSSSSLGQFGGDDKWFSPMDEDFYTDIDQGQTVVFPGPPKKFK